jgi:hypothetical protein
MISCRLASIIFCFHVGMIDGWLAGLPTCNSSVLQACWIDGVLVIRMAGLLSF